LALKIGFRGLWFEFGILEKDYGWLRLTAAADCGPFLVPDGGLQGVSLLEGRGWKHFLFFSLLIFPGQLTINLELFRTRGIRLFN
jgi:hypothetical protein